MLVKTSINKKWSLLCPIRVREVLLLLLTLNKANPWALLQLQGF
jgi:hypothetical protein